MAAAVSDYRPAAPSASKLKRRSASATINLVANDDILLALGSEKRRQALVGFAAETEDLLENAREKMIRKKTDIMVANDVSSGVFGEDSVTVFILRPGFEPLEMRSCPKSEIAERTLEIAAAGLVPLPGRTAGP